MDWVKVLARPLSAWGLLIAGLPFAVWAQAPTGLTVKSATSKQVVLSWSGVASSYTVQRAPLGGGFTSVGTVTTATYTDTTIDAYTTYQYQVLNGTAASAAVTVGPPPAGITNAAPAPIVGTTLSDSYGYNLAVTLDGNGDPAFLFIWEDPTNTSDSSLNQLLFRSWNRAQYQWNPVVKVAVVGDVATTFHTATSLAYDASTSTYVAASETADKQGGTDIQLFVSTDGGATWSTKATLGPNGNSVHGPSVALANGNIYFAYMTDYAGLTYMTGKVSSAFSTWTSKPDPGGSNNTTLVGTAPSIALDSAGNPGIAYFAENPNGPAEYNPTLYFWRPAVTGSPVRITDNQSQGQDDSCLKLAFFGTNPRILFWLDRGDGPVGNEDVGVHFVRSDDGGLTWKPVVVVPPDGNATTDHPFDMAFDSKGDVAVGFGQNGSYGDDSHHCPGGPRLSFSTDLVNFTTCPPSNAAVTALANDSAADFGPFPAGIQVVYGGNDKLYLLWQGDGDSQSNAGIMMYREPPPTAITGPNITAVADAASFRANIVGGSWVSIFGTNLSTTARSWASADFNSGNNLPTTLDGVSVKINGIAAAICYISPTLVSVQAPSPLSGTVTVQLTHNGVAGNTVTATAVTNAPSLFVYNAGTKTYPSALYTNNLIVGDPALSGNIVAKAKTNDVIQLYVNAIGPSTSGIIINNVVPFASPLTVTIGGVNAPVQFVGLVATGEFQINVMVPSVPSGEQPIVVTTGGQSSQSGVTIPIQ